jgi:hypothetical protein
MNAEIILNVMVALFIHQIGWSLFFAVTDYFKEDEETNN